MNDYSSFAKVLPGKVGDQAASICEEDTSGSQLQLRRTSNQKEKVPQAVNSYMLHQFCGTGNARLVLVIQKMMLWLADSKDQLSSRKIITHVT
jgi:hypothetical protein